MFSIWRLALLYGAAYVVFALFATQRLSGMADNSATTLLSYMSVYCLAAAAALALGSWRLRLRLLKIGACRRDETPSAAQQSGLAAAVIVITTILAFVLSPDHFVLSLALMRGGVLIMAPAFDVLHQRRIGKAAWAAVGLCLSTAAIAMLVSSDPGLSELVWINLVAYWAAYAFRLAAISNWAKQSVPGPRALWFVAEVELCARFLIAAGVATGLGGLVLGPFDDGVIVAATATALSYGFVFYFGTLIYLDWRENAFAVTLNRAASLLGGVVAAFIAWAGLGSTAPSIASLSAAGLVLLGVLALALDRRDGTRHP